MLRADRALEQAADFREETAADKVAVGIVDVLEVVEIEEAEAEVRLDGEHLGVGGFGDLLLELGVETARVEQAGAVVGDAEVVDELDVASVLERDGGVVAEDAEEADGVLGQEVQRAVVQLHDAHGALAAADGKAGDGTEVELRVLLGEAGPVGVAADIRHDERVAGLGDPAGDAFAELDAELVELVGIEAGGEGVVEVVGFLIDEHERPALGSEELGHLVHDGVEQRFELERGGESPRHIVEDPEVFHLAHVDDFGLSVVSHSTCSGTCLANGHHSRRARGGLYIDWGSIGFGVPF